MASLNKTFLEALEERAGLHPDEPLFWIPQNVEPEKPASKWKPMTYAQFYAEVSTAKRFYHSQMTKLNIVEGSVIGIWLPGGTIPTVINPIQTFGLSAAGFTPLLCCLYFSSSPIIFELLVNSGAKALVIDSSLPEVPDLSRCPVTVVDIANSDSATLEVSSENLALRPYAEVKDDIALIFHSSSSTGRIPKLIPRSHYDISLSGARFAFSDVAVRMGNFNHASGRIQLVGPMFNGGSILIPSSSSFSGEELGSMIRACGLATLTLVTTALVPLLQAAQSDLNLLSMIKSLRGIRCLGSAFPADMAAWCQSVGLSITNTYGNTECGSLMKSSPSGNPLLLKPITGILCEWLPYESEQDAKLLEFMLPAGSSGLPHSSLLAPDGNFYSGDLFEPAEDGYYLFRGRKEDWIIMSGGHVCDTKSIDDAVQQLCKDVVFDCVTVGSGRPSPAVLVEPTENVERETIPRIIVERLATFNQSRCPHERLDDPRLVLVVNRGALPRTVTKGNVRRQGSEEVFSNELNEMYEAI